MKFYTNFLWLILFLISGKELVCAAAKKLPEYDEFVLTNTLLQDINSVLEGKSEPEKKQIMEYLYSEIDLITFNNATTYTDKATVYRIKEKIQALPYLSCREAEELQQLTSTCLKVIPGRGVKYTLSTILKCFVLAEKRLSYGKNTGA